MNDTQKMLQVIINGQSTIKQELSSKIDTVEPIEGVDRTLQLESLYSQNPVLLALLNTFRTYEWTIPYQPLDYSFKYMQQILYDQPVNSL